MHRIKKENRPNSGSVSRRGVFMYGSAFKKLFNVLKINKFISDGTDLGGVSEHSRG